MTPSPAARAMLAGLIWLIAVLGIGSASNAAASTMTAGSVRPASVSAGSVEMSVVDTAPSTITTGTGTTVKVLVRNTGTGTLDGASLRLSIGTRALDSLTTQERWTQGRLPLGSAATADADIPAIAPGKSATVQLSIPSAKLDLNYTMTTLPMRVDLRGTGSSDTMLRSFATWASQDATFTKMTTSIVVPVTLPHDPKLLTATGSERLEAWRKAIGPGSDIDKLISSNPSVPVTWLIDPAVLDPAAAQDGTLPTAAQEGTNNPTPSASSTTSGSPSGSSSSGSPGSSSSSSSSDSSSATSSSSASTSSSSSSTSSTSDATPAATVDELASDLRAKLAARPSTQDILFTPYGDPDLSTLTDEARPAGSQEVLERSLARSLSSELEALSSDVVAAPTAPLSQAAAARLTAAWKKARGTAPTVITPNVTLDRTDAVSVSTAVRRTGDGLTLAGYNSSLSKALDDDSLSDAEAAATARAASLAVYQQQPTTTRSLLIMGSRDQVTSASRLTQVTAAIKGAAWIQPEAFSTNVASGTSTVSLAQRAPSSESVWPRVDAQAFDARDLATAHQTLSTLTRMAGIVTDGADIVPAWTRNLDQVTSTRWRGSPTEVDTLVKHASTTVNAIPKQINVVPSRINFFSDSGPISVTVKNGLAREVHGVQVHLTPRTYAVQFRDQPEPVTIPGKGQASMRVSTIAQAPGRVSVDAKVTGPGGITLGETGKQASVIEINARPTGTWIFWVLGIVALLVFCYGLVRNRQRGTRRRDELARDIQL